MKDFDEARTARSTRDAEERSFKLGGETFTIRPAVRPETLAAAARVTTDSGVADDIEAFDELILGFLEDEGRARYETLRRREEDPVTFTDLMEVAAWMVEVNSGRPTVQPSPSSAGLPQTPTSLTVVSPSQAETQTA